MKDPGQSPARISVITDFDGTACESDLSQIALDRFGEEGWERFDSALDRGEIGLYAAIAQQFSRLRAPSEESILEYLGERCQVRSGLPELFAFCQAWGVPFFVASGGLDFAIRHTFRRSRLEGVELVCPRTEVGPEGSRVTFPDGFALDETGDFKEALVLQQKASGRRVVYVGNGLSDFAAVTHADHVFAMEDSALERKCRKIGIRATTVRDFLPVLDYLKRELGA